MGKFAIYFFSVACLTQNTEITHTTPELEITSEYETESNARDSTRQPARGLTAASAILQLSQACARIHRPNQAVLVLNPSHINTSANFR